MVSISMSFSFSFCLSRFRKHSSLPWYCILLQQNLYISTVHLALCQLLVCKRNPYLKRAAWRKRTFVNSCLYFSSNIFCLEKCPEVQWVYLALAILLNGERESCTDWGCVPNSTLFPIHYTNNSNSSTEPSLWDKSRSDLWSAKSQTMQNQSTRDTGALLTQALLTSQTSWIITRHNLGTFYHGFNGLKKQCCVTR